MGIRAMAEIALDFEEDTDYAKYMVCLASHFARFARLTFLLSPTERFGGHDLDFS
jgi:hypothetical protein